MTKSLTETIWQTIRPSLRKGQQGYIDFFEVLGFCPPGHELRPKRDGKRAPFDLTHFEWVEIGTPKRLDRVLQKVSLQIQLDRLQARIEAIERLTKVGDRP